LQDDEADEHSAFGQAGDNNQSRSRQYRDPEKRREQNRRASQRARHRARQREEQVVMLQQQVQHQCIVSPREEAGGISDKTSQ